MQILFTALAFAAMVVLSHIFMSSIVRDSLLRTANCMITCMQERVSSSLLEARSEITGFAEVTRDMVVRGAAPDTLRNYSNAISAFSFASNKNTKEEFYGYFETPPGGPVLIHSDRWLPLHASAPERSAWYQAAITAADGAIVETTPYYKDDTKVTVLSLAAKGCSP